MSNTESVFHFSLDQNLEDLCDKYNKLHSTGVQLSSEMFLPSKTQGSGYEVRCAEANGIIFNPGQYKSINLGFGVFCPEGWALNLMLHPNLFNKKHLHCLSATVDDYVENVKISAQYIPDSSFLIKNNLNISFGEIIGYLVPVRKEEVKILNVSKSELKRMHLFRF